MFHLHYLLAGALACTRQKWQKWWYPQKKYQQILGFVDFHLRNSSLNLHFLLFPTIFSKFNSGDTILSEEITGECREFCTFSKPTPRPFALLPAPFRLSVEDFMIIPRSSKAARIRAPWDPSIWAMHHGPLVGYRLYRRWQATQSCGGLFHKPSKNKFPSNQPRTFSEGMVYLTTWKA